MSDLITHNFNHVFPREAKLSRLVKDVISLEEKAQALDRLCSEMMATFMVNTDRGTIKFDNQEVADSWAAQILRWQYKFGEIVDYDFGKV